MRAGFVAAAFRRARRLRPDVLHREGGRAVCLLPAEGPYIRICAVIPNPAASFADGGARCVRPGAFSREGICFLFVSLGEANSSFAAVGEGTLTELF
jgi:hypothetical protein